MSLELDTTRFNHLVAALIAITGKDAVEEVRNQGRLLIDGSNNIPGLFGITPPAGGGVTGTAAKKRGERKEGDKGDGLHFLAGHGGRVSRRAFISERMAACPASLETSCVSCGSASWS